MSKPNDMKKINLKVEFPDDPSNVKYSNLSLVTHLPEEFVLNFAQMVPGKPTAKVVSQIVMTPRNAKSFLNSLAANIKNYEEKFGEIVVSTSQAIVDPNQGIQ